MKSIKLMVSSALGFMIVGPSFQVVGMENYEQKHSTSIRNSSASKYSVNNFCLTNSYSASKYSVNLYPAYNHFSMSNTVPLQDSEEENKDFSSSSSSSDDSSDDKIEEENRNKYGLIFNKIINELSLSDKTKSEDGLLDDSFQKWEALHKIGESFVDNAMLYGRIIIREYRLPEHEKTIKPVSIGGIAGGEKYIAQGILFKFATDKLMDNNKWLYGGASRNDYFAAKSAGQELLSANYVGSYDPLIKVPLMAVVDYWGQRLMAIALLPVDNEHTLIYGSADGGKTIFSSNETINNTMDSLGKKLNLQKHMVGDVPMALCGDVEVHVCKLGKIEAQYYCLDTARVFPPESPIDMNNPNSVFYEKLRPEFVKDYILPLSSDGLTGWQRGDLLCGTYDRNIKEATKNLREEKINSCIKGFTPDKIEKIVLTATSKYYVLDWSNHDYIPNPLISYLHQHGINIRHLGDVLKRLETTNSREVNITQYVLKKLKKHIYNVMIARVLKNEIRQVLREKTSEGAEYKDKFIHIMNLLTCKNPRSEVFWQETIPKLIKTKFRVSVNNLSQKIHQGFLLLNFCQLTGVILNPKIFEKVANQYHKKMFFEFGVPDILDIKPTIKYLNIIDFASGLYFLNMSDQNKENNLRISMDYLQKARDRLVTSLSTWCNGLHPMLPAHLSSTVKTIKECILEHQLQWQTKGAEQGDIEAQYHLGLRYVHGEDVPRDDDKAIKWLTKAAKQGNVKAQFRLGEVYFFDGSYYKKAIKWYTKAAEQEYANAQYKLGLMYEEGKGVPQSDTEAVKWYTKAAEQGRAFYQYRLGQIYEKCQGVLQSHTEALKWYTKAAEQGEVEAQYRLGGIYKNGQGVPQSHTEAVKWYTKAAEQEYANAQYQLGEMYKNGQGVPQSHTEAVKWYTKAAEQGEVLSQIELRHMYKNGQGVPQGFEKMLEKWDAAFDSRYTYSDGDITTPDWTWY